MHEKRESITVDSCFHTSMSMWRHTKTTTENIIHCYINHSWTVIVTEEQKVNWGNKFPLILHHSNHSHWKQSVSLSTRKKMKSDAGAHIRFTVHRHLAKSLFNGYKILFAHLFQQLDWPAGLPPNRITTRCRHSDILKTILVNSSGLPCSCIYEHVKAHQYDNGKYDTLLHQSQLNCYCDGG